MSSSSVEYCAQTPVRTVGLLVVLLLSGCAGLEREQSQLGATQAEVVAVAPTTAGEAPATPATPPVAVEPVVQLPAAPVVAETMAHSAPPPVAVEPVVRPAPPPMPRSINTSVAKTDSPSIQPSVKAPVTAVLTKQPQKKESAAPSVGQQQASLDMAALKTRLRETNAIGMFTKITLKNQVDELMNQFRGFYQGRVKTTLPELRHAYDRLLLKVLALLQDGDQQLASAIVASRDAIWGILADPAKFATL